MRFSTKAWRAAVVSVTAVSFGAGLRTVGVAVVVLAAVMALTGAAFAWSWHEDAAIRRRAVARGALWGGSGGAIVAGLPSVIGTWSLVVLVVLCVTAPAVVARARRAVTAARPPREHPELSHLSDRDLERRWHRTTRRVRAPGLAPAGVADLVEERARLLDELERRDPDRFVAWLASA